MSNLNFLHSGGNKVTLSAPTSDPSSNPNFKLPQSDGSAGQFLKTDGSGALSFATPTDTVVTTAGGTMTIGFQDHVAGNTSSTTATGYYQRIGNMVWATVDTGSINKSGSEHNNKKKLTTTTSDDGNSAKYLDILNKYKP